MYKESTRQRVGLYEKALPNDISWEEKLKTTKLLGFDFLEISVDESDERRSRLDWSEEAIYKLRRICERQGIHIQSMCLSAHRKYPFGSRDSDIRNRAKTHMEKALSFSYRLGIRVIQLAGYDVYYESSDEKTHQNFVDGIKLSSRLAERAGVMLAVEIMDTSYLNSLVKFEILNRTVGSPYFTAYPDVGNITGWNLDVCSELLLAMPRITQIHLKDTKKIRPGFPGQFRNLVIGEGDVDFNAVFKTLKVTNCNVPLVVEMWAEDSDWMDNILSAQQHLNKACQEAQLPDLFLT